MGHHSVGQLFLTLPVHGDHLHLIHCVPNKLEPICWGKSPQQALDACASHLCTSTRLNDAGNKPGLDFRLPSEPGWRRGCPPLPCQWCWERQGWHYLASQKRAKPLLTLQHHIPSWVSFACGRFDKGSGGSWRGRQQKRACQLSLSSRVLVEASCLLCGVWHLVGEWDNWFARPLQTTEATCVGWPPLFSPDHKF